MSLNNQPMSYDFHGDIDFRVPFNKISKNDISFYLDIDTFVGKETCGQNCNHCWFVNYEKVHQKTFDLEEGHQIYSALKEQGYVVYPRYVDSFAYDGKFMEVYGSQNNREFRFGDESQSTETMEAGDAWTSGRPLLSKNYVELLDTCTRNGFGTISITFHGTFDEKQNLNPHTSYPIKGVFPGSKTLEVIKRIHFYNKNHLPKGKKPLRINIGVTIGTHNHTKESILAYCQLFNDLNISTLRFNCFTDHGKKHPHLQLSQEQVRQFYLDFKELHDKVPCNFQLGISEDFGTNGVEVLGLPGHVGWCRAGRQLFAIVPVAPLIQDDGSEKIADIVGCVNIFEPYLGYITRTPAQENNTPCYQVCFDETAIDTFTNKRLDGEFTNGCFAGEMLQSDNYHVPLVAEDAIEVLVVE